MTLHLTALRAAEDFANALDGTAESHVADRYAPLVATATLLREHPVPPMRPEFAVSLREELMAAAETELIPGPRLVSAGQDRAQRPRRTRERHLGAAAAAAILVATTGGVAAAADSSLPGDALYPIKRGVEQLQVAMNNNDAAKGAELLQQAGTRLDEIDGLLASNGSAEQIDSTLSDYSKQASEGSALMFRAFRAHDNPEDIVTVREFTTGQVRQIAEISDLAPPTSTSDFGAVAALLSDIDQQARVLCDDCSGAAAVAAPAMLAGPGNESSMAELVAAPIESAVLTLRQVLPEGLSGAAQQAEQTAKRTPKSSTTDTGAPGSAPSTGSQQPKPGDTPKQSAKPLRDIVTGVTSELPLPEAVKRITRPLGEVTEPLTDTVDGLLGGLGGTLGGTLGGLTGRK